MFCPTAHFHDSNKVGKPKKFQVSRFREQSTRREYEKAAFGPNGSSCPGIGGGKGGRGLVHKNRQFFQVGMSVFCFPGLAFAHQAVKAFAVQLLVHYEFSSQSYVVKDDNTKPYKGGWAGTALKKFFFFFFFFFFFKYSVI